MNRKWTLVTLVALLFLVGAFGPQWVLASGENVRQKEVPTRFDVSGLSSMPLSESYLLKVDWPSGFDVKGKSLYRVSTTGGQDKYNVWADEEKMKSIMEAQPALYKYKKVDVSGVEDLSEIQGYILTAKEVVLERIRVALIEQAIGVACEANTMPEQISVSMALNGLVGIGLEVSGEVTVEATWDTARLCK